MAVVKQSDRVRAIVQSDYVKQARNAGLERFSVCARDVLRLAEASPDFPRARTPLICNVLQSKKLLDEGGLEIERIEGPPSLQSRKVVVHYRVLPRAAHANANQDTLVETAEERAFRLTENLRGLMKDEIGAHGGAEGYLRWVRGQDEVQSA